MRRRAKIAVLALFSLGLLALLAWKGGLTWRVIAHTIGSLGWPALVSVWALTVAALTCTTLKWLLVMRACAPDDTSHPGFVEAMLTTVLGALVGQVMPFQVGVALARSAAGRVGVGRSPSFNLGTTAYEQLFDAVVLAVAGAIGLVGLVFRPGAVGWLLLILFLGSFGAFASLRFTLLLVATGRMLSRVSHRNRLFRSVSNLGAAVSRAETLPPSIFARLTALSVLRYGVMSLRAVLVLAALGMSKFAMVVILGFPLVNTIGLLPITPGNLGVTEWTWSALLVASGAAMSGAALFALTARIVTLMAQLILFSLLVALRFLQGAATARRPLATN